MSYNSEVYFAESNPEPYKKAAFYNTYNLFIKLDNNSVVFRRLLRMKMRGLRMTTGLKKKDIRLVHRMLEIWRPGDKENRRHPEGYSIFRVYIKVQKHWTVDQVLRFKRRYEKIRKIFKFRLKQGRSIVLLNPNTAPYSQFAT